MKVWTERRVLDCLAAHYAQTRAGSDRYVYAEQVRSGVGYVDGQRVLDAVSMDCWQSRRYGLELHGHEVKVARGDWLQELHEPEKASAFLPYLHCLWLVTPEHSNVERGDLPAEWGMMVTRHDGSVKVVTEAPRRDPEPMPSAMLGSLLRAVAKTRTVSTMRLPA